MPESRERRPVVFFHDGPGGFDPDPVQTGRRNIELTTVPPDGRFASVGWGVGGLRAAELAAQRGADVTRLVLCAVPAPAGGEGLTFDIGSIVAKTLLLYGQVDQDAPPSSAEWWKTNLPGGARVEIVPRHGSDFVEAMWGRALSHAAPGSLRRG
jgi:pimeloyl-ACP methyl ester carboxylesterase